MPKLSLKKERIDRGGNRGDAVVAQERLRRPVYIALVGDAGGKVRPHRFVSGTEDAVKVLADRQQLDVVAKIGGHHVGGRRRIGGSDSEHVGCEAGEEAVVADLQHRHPIGADHLLIDEADHTARVDAEAGVLGLGNDAEVVRPVLSAVVRRAQVQDGVGGSGAGHVGDQDAVGVGGIDRDGEVRTVAVVAEGGVLEIRVVPGVGDAGGNPHPCLAVAGIDQRLERRRGSAPVQVLHDDDIALIGGGTDSAVVAVERRIDGATGVDRRASGRHVEGEAHVERGRGRRGRYRRVGEHVDSGTVAVGVIADIQPILADTAGDRGRCLEEGLVAGHCGDRRLLGGGVRGTVDQDGEAARRDQTRIHLAAAAAVAAGHVPGGELVAGGARQHELQRPGIAAVNRTEYWSPVPGHGRANGGGAGRIVKGESGADDLAGVCWIHRRGSVRSPGSARRSSYWGSC